MFVVPLLSGFNLTKLSVSMLYGCEVASVIEQGYYIIVCVKFPRNKTGILLKSMYYKGDLSLKLVPYKDCFRFGMCFCEKEMF